MKTVKKNKEVLRASDSEAEQLVEQGWKYCPKSEWRKHKDVEMFEPPKKKKKGKKLDKKTS